MPWPRVRLGDVSTPKQWPILSKNQMSESGYPVYGANGQIGFSLLKTHDNPVVLVGCRGTCGSVHLAPAKSYANGNAMAIDGLRHDVEARFLSRWLSYRGFRDVITGSSQPQITRENIVRVEVPLPPIAEQRRIADILDRADALRAKRREALALLDDLTQSIFLHMFGGEVLPSVEFGSLTRGMRNGVSPSTNGSAIGRVLTLSAVTQGAFDASASKEAAFAHEPPPGSRVRSRDILFCRGNGNLGLVGAAVHPDENRPDLVFPDTVIAAEFQPSLVDPMYLTLVWRQPTVRQQIESAARTTNGTFKINQQVLSSVQVPLPHIEQQRQFAVRAANVNTQRGSIQRALMIEDELFVSLQQRAFVGEI